MPKIKTVTVSDIAENCYVLENNGLAVLVDPGGESEKIKAALGGAKITAILLTHGHFDHIAALPDFPGIPVYIHEADAVMLGDADKNGARYFGFDIAVFPEELHLLKDLDTFEEAGMTFQIMHLPGHTPGSSAYLTDDQVFTGDTLFETGYGRTDLWGGSSNDLFRSLRRIMQYMRTKPCIGRPGHGASFTLCEPI